MIDLYELSPDQMAELLAGWGEPRFRAKQLWSWLYERRVASFEAMTNLPVGPMGVILIMMLIWIILGCFIDWIGILLLTAPIFVPVASALGFDLVWLGVLFCMNMQISYVSPPFGPAAFYLKGVVPPDISLGDIFRSILPYMVLQLIALGLVLSFPQIALWLPSTMTR